MAMIRGLLTSVETFVDTNEVRITIRAEHLGVYKLNCERVSELVSRFMVQKKNVGVVVKGL